MKPVHLRIDSSGLSVHVGQLRTPPKARDYRKLHLAVDEQPSDVVAGELTSKRARDASRVASLVGQIERPIASAKADAAYDTATPATRESRTVIAVDDRRSTKAGASTPATHVHEDARARRVARSTKAGASTPATRDGLGCRAAPGHRSTKAGASTPATLARSIRPRPRSPTLNEGRSVNPGYTRTFDPSTSTGVPRSTKAGASTPATQAVPEQEHGMIYLAQRRPERQPRLHPPSARRWYSSWKRAQRRPERQPRLHTRYERAHSCRVDAQRRPERQPRLHAREGHVIDRVILRSTKAGASTPATRPVGAQLDFGLQRSTKAGASTPATRWTGLRSGWGARRSTKAGASTPATRDVQRRPRRGCRSSLNEGRSVNPGYTGITVAAFIPGRGAQRRPERQPRLHS